MIAEKLLQMERDIIKIKTVIENNLNEIQAAEFYLPPSVRQSTGFAIRAARIEVLMLNNVLNAINELKKEVATELSNR